MNTIISAGYYGERGYLAISDTLRYIFPIAMTSTSFTYNDYILHVLLPYAADLLIQEDLSITLDEATQVRDDSASFGRLYQPNDFDIEDPQELSLLNMILTEDVSKYGLITYEEWIVDSSSQTFDEWWQSSLVVPGPFQFNDSFMFTDDTNTIHK